MLSLLFIVTVIDLLLFLVVSVICCGCLLLDTCSVAVCGVSVGAGVGASD